MGVHNVYLRQKILAAFEEGESNGYHKLASSPEGDSSTAPSAPLAPDTPSAPPMAPLETYQSNECVVCLENKVKQIHQVDEILLPNILYCSATSSFSLVATFARAGNVKRASTTARCAVPPSPRKFDSTSLSKWHVHFAKAVSAEITLFSSLSLSSSYSFGGVSFDSFLDAQQLLLAHVRHIPMLLWGHHYYFITEDVLSH